MDSKLLFPLATAFLVLCLVDTGESAECLGCQGVFWLLASSDWSLASVARLEDGGHTSVREWGPSSHVPGQGQ